MLRAVHQLRLYQTRREDRKHYLPPFRFVVRVAGFFVLGGGFFFGCCFEAEEEEVKKPRIPLLSFSASKISLPPGEKRAPDVRPNS